MQKIDHRRVVPYTTKTGVQIGRLYQPKADVSMSRDMEMLQGSLLARPVYFKDSLLDRMAGSLVRLMRSV
jgi:hypothetical protein